MFQNGPRLEAFRLSSRAFSHAQGENGSGWLGLIGLRTVSLRAFLQKFGWGIERWSRSRPIRIHVQKCGDSANLCRGIQHVSHSGRQDYERVDWNDGDILPVIFAAAGDDQRV
jgi:hypothetical protein